jgi:hypothetical protein
MGEIFLTLNLFNRYAAGAGLKGVSLQKTEMLGGFPFLQPYGIDH